MTCVAQLDVGAACTDNGQCLTGNCSDAHLRAHADGRRERVLRLTPETARAIARLAAPARSAACGYF